LTVNVSPDRVRARINVKAVQDLKDPQVQSFIDDATAIVEDETGATIVSTACLALEAVAITCKAALLAYAHLKSGGPANVTYTAGGVLAVQTGDPTIQILEKTYQEAIKRLSEVAFKVAESNQTTDDQLWE